MRSIEIGRPQEIAETKLAQLRHMVGLDLTMFELRRRGVFGSWYNESLADAQRVIRRGIFTTLLDVADTAVDDKTIQIAWSWVNGSRKLQARLQESNEALNLGDEAQLQKHTLLVKKYLDQKLKP